MLSNQTIQIIKSTVPVLEQHGEAVTKRFYELLFTNHPQLLNIFNHANQKQGRQQTALANAVYAAAQNIDKLEAMLPAVRQIAHKHRSLGIQAEQYPIVGQHLLAAMKDVLGAAATDEILQAWAEAYNVIANVFIEVEADMYRQAEQQQGGWAGFRNFRVARKVKESEVITSFYLAPQDGGELADFKPGQYVSVKLDIPSEANTHIRQYSLSDAPGRPYYRISVKREEAIHGKPAGKVSVYLHECIQEGDVLGLSAPAGEFTCDPREARPLVLISGGVGLTPLVSMLKTAAAAHPGRTITFIHAARNGTAHALRREVEEVAKRSANISCYWCYEQPTIHDKAQQLYDKAGHIDLAWLQQIIPFKDASYYFCGPVPFMQKVYAELRTWGIAGDNLHYEFFGPSGQLAEAAQQR